MYGVESRRVKSSALRSVSWEFTAERMSRRSAQSSIRSLSCWREIVLPNPVTLTLMKLAAMRDQHEASQEPSKTLEQRALADGQARKHTTDLFRIAAMITREENDRIPIVLDAARCTEAFEDGREIFAALFGKVTHGGASGRGPMWRPEDKRLIRDTLSNGSADISDALLSLEHPLGAEARIHGIHASGREASDDWSRAEWIQTSRGL